MGLTPTEVHRRFTALPGSEQVASEFAIAGLVRWLRRRLPGTILEVGSGIGTMTSVLAEYAKERPRGFRHPLPLPFPDAKPFVVAVEDDAWCRFQALQHSGILPRTSGVSPWLWSDWAFVIIDGGEPRDDYYANLCHRAVVFFEGNRRDQRATLEEMWRGGRPFCKANWRPADRSKGVWIYQFDPTILELIWFAAVNIREWLRDWPARLAGRPVGKRREVTRC